jgi:hypothetical protein
MWYNKWGQVRRIFMLEKKKFINLLLFIIVTTSILYVYKEALGETISYTYEKEIIFPWTSEKYSKASNFRFVII